MLSRSSSVATPGFPVQGFETAVTVFFTSALTAVATPGFPVQGFETVPRAVSRRSSLSSRHPGSPFRGLKLSRPYRIAAIAHVATPGFPVQGFETRLDKHLVVKSLSRDTRVPRSGV